METKKKINLIIIAMEEELDAFLGSLNLPIEEENVLNEVAYSFSQNEEKYLVVRGRIGKVSTALYLGRLVEIYQIKRVFNIGTSGAVNNTLNKGDIVIADRVCYHDVDVTGFHYQMGQVPGCPMYFEADKKYLETHSISDKNYQVKVGLIASGDSFITDKNYHHFMIEELDAYCVEMEAGAVGQCCYQLGIPFIVIRSISDSVIEGNNKKDNETNIKKCCQNCSEVLLELIK